ncbi:melatonin receptor type 1C-like [Protopterus annectens]|uniref:melatonin receptor type 1C-like n=1 Tax=Protopterus annectens TaxID=7888 RepID=UPI001CFB8E13|nr:melatonin receptor type 1C-like [Protopterus annectens]
MAKLPELRLRWQAIVAQAEELFQDVTRSEAEPEEASGRKRWCPLTTPGWGKRQQAEKQMVTVEAPVPSMSQCEGAGNDINLPVVGAQGGEDGEAQAVDEGLLDGDMKGKKQCQTECKGVGTGIQVSRRTDGKRILILGHSYIHWAEQSALIREDGNINTSSDSSTPLARNHTAFPAYEISENLTILLATVMIFTTTTDIFGNILVVMSVLQNKKLRNAGNMFVISLSAADVLGAVYPYPLIIASILQNQWQFGELQCQISAFIQGLSFNASLYNIMVIAINRCCCICHGMKYDKIFTMRNTYCYIFLTWAISFSLVLPFPLLGALQYNPHVYICTFISSVNKVFTTGITICLFILPVSIVILCYASIWITVLQVKYRIKRDSKQTLQPSDMRNFLTMFAVFVVFAVCWAPFAIPGLIAVFSPPGKAPNFPDWLFVLGFFSACFNSCLNGIVYGVFNKNFRQEYKQILWHLLTFIIRAIN